MPEHNDKNQLFPCPFCESRIGLRNTHCFCGKAIYHHPWFYDFRVGDHKCGRFIVLDDLGIKEINKIFKDNSSKAISQNKKDNDQGKFVIWTTDQPDLKIICCYNQFISNLVDNDEAVIRQIAPRFREHGMA